MGIGQVLSFEAPRSRLRTGRGIRCVTLLTSATFHTLSLPRGSDTPASVVRPARDEPPGSMPDELSQVLEEVRTAHKAERNLMKLMVGLEPAKLMS